MWTLDPIDGTKGFLRGEQYAVCLAFLVDAKVQVGVMGCPNLPVDASKPDGPKGCLFVAVRGQGAEQVRMLTQYDFRFLFSFTSVLLEISHKFKALHTLHPSLWRLRNQLPRVRRGCTLRTGVQ